jgi:adenylate kinase
LNIVLLGPPGAGKGTQAKVLSQKFNVLHVSTGDMLREAVKAKTGVGKAAKTYMDTGELVPDNIVIDIVTARISEGDAGGGFLLDGFPRNEKQAGELDEALATVGEKLDAVLYFKTSKETSIQRLSGRRVCTACGINFHVKNMPPKRRGVCDHCGASLVQREDDKEETVKKRLVVYENETKSLITYYKEKGLLREVAGDLDVDDLFKDIAKLFVNEGLI